MPLPTQTLSGSVKIPVVGLGVWQIPDAKVEEVITSAFRLGYRHIDTARIYGNEAGVGRAVRHSRVPRSQLFITTKLWAIDIFNPSAGLRGSLQRLGLDYVDLYLIHWPFPFWSSAWKKLAKLVGDGRVRSIGVSNFSISDLRRLRQISSLIPAVNQIEISPFNTRRDLVAYCRDQGIVVQSYSPLTRGFKLSDPSIVSLATKYRRTPAQIMLRWGLQHQFVVLPKASTDVHLQENISIFDFKISPSDMDLLDSLDSRFSAMFRL